MTAICNKMIDNYPGIALRYKPETGEIIHIGGMAKAILLDKINKNKTLCINDLRALVIKNDKKKLVDFTQQNIAEKSNWNVEYRIKYKNKTKWLREQAQFCEISKKPVIDLFIHDVTEFKIQHKKLKSKLSSATKTANLKNEFFASMSHEIRTPMNAVMGMAQILTKTQMDIEQKQYLDTIVNASHSLVQVINDILDVSKLEAGKIDLLQEEVDLEKLCLDVCHLLTARAEEKHIQLYLDYKSINRHVVISDGGRIRQILINLIGNAIKFTEKGHVILRVNYNSKENVYKFSVIDTGIGIPLEAQKSVFEAFSQADATTSKKFGGTGLGLQICQKIVSLMKGDLGLQSKVGKGSTFWFSLPLISNDNNQASPILTGAQCLLVDNDPVNMDIMSKIFLNANAEVTKINDSEDVLALLTNNDINFDYIIIDQSLSGLDGLKLASLIKRDKRYLNVPIILLTSMTARENKLKLFDSGINAYLTKPLSPSILFSAIKSTQNNKDQTEAIYISNKSYNADQENLHLHFTGKALIADDLEVNQFILNSMLSQLGIVADFANNGLEALEKVKNNNYDLIFMDCRMPIMDGYEATAKIKSLNNEKSKIPIIALTANAGEKEKQICYDAGMDGFLSKPYTEEEIVNIIKTWISKEKTEIISKTNTKEEVANQILNFKQFNAIKETLGDEFITFAEGMPDKYREYYDDISAALIKGNMSEVHEKSHALKGLSALIGAVEVSKLAAILEQAGVDKDLEAANLSLSKLDSAISEFQIEILNNINPDMADSVILF